MGGWLGVGEKVTIDPDPPLVGRTDGHHFLCGLEGAEDVDEGVVADHHFLEEVDDLREREHIDVGEPIPDGLHLDPQLTFPAPDHRADGLPVLNALELLGRRVTCLILLLGWPSHRHYTARKARVLAHEVLERLNDREVSLVAPAVNLQLLFYGLIGHLEDSLLTGETVLLSVGNASSEDGGNRRYVPRGTTFFLGAVHDHYNPLLKIKLLAAPLSFCTQRHKAKC